MGLGMYLSPFTLSSTPHKSFDYPDTEQLLDWSAWEKYRHSVSHPCLTIKENNLAAAKENIKDQEWAKVHFGRIHGIIKSHINKITPEFLNSMVEETTPGIRFGHLALHVGTKACLYTRMDCGVGRLKNRKKSNVLNVMQCSRTMTIRKKLY